jgi:hypothetical protein
MAGLNLFACCLTCSSALEIEYIRSYETSINFYRPTSPPISVLFIVTAMRTTSLSFKNILSKTVESSRLLMSLGCDDWCLMLEFGLFRKYVTQNVEGLPSFRRILHLQVSVCISSNDGSTSGSPSTAKGIWASKTPEDINPDGRNCIVRRNIGKTSKFYAEYSWKPKLCR